MRAPRKAYKRAMSPERVEALRKHQAKQEVRGQCRRCRATWTGLRMDLPAKCPSCGFPDGA